MMSEKPIRRLYELAYGRAGDKGNIANVSVIARSPEAYDEIKAKVTAERVKAHLGPLVKGRVERFELDNIHALNFVLYDALDGGATRSLRLDALGKSLAGAVLYMPIDGDH
jgi:outer membrane PBP1 activator LpoA protein